MFSVACGLEHAFSSVYGHVTVRFCARVAFELFGVALTSAWECVLVSDGYGDMVVFFCVDGLRSAISFSSQVLIVPQKWGSVKIEI